MCYYLSDHFSNRKVYKRCYNLLYYVPDHSMSVRIVSMCKVIFHTGKFSLTQTISREVFTNTDAFVCVCVCLLQKFMQDFNAVTTVLCCVVHDFCQQHVVALCMIFIITPDFVGIGVGMAGTVLVCQQFVSAGKLKLIFFLF